MLFSIYAISIHSRGVFIRYKSAYNVNVYSRKYIFWSPKARIEKEIKLVEKGELNAKMIFKDYYKVIFNPSGNGTGPIHQKRIKDNFL